MFPLAHTTQVGIPNLLSIGSSVTAQCPCVHSTQTTERATSVATGCIFVIIIIITTTMFMVLLSPPKSLPDSHGSFDSCRLSAGGRQHSDQANWLGLWVRRKLAAITDIQCYYYSTVGWYSFCRPNEGGRLSRPGICGNDAQPVPKAAYHGSCRDKHNCPRCDSNLGPLTPQSDALTTRPMRPYCDAA